MSLESYYLYSGESTWKYRAFFMFISNCIRFGFAQKDSSFLNSVIIF